MSLETKLSAHIYAHTHADTHAHTRAHSTHALTQTQIYTGTHRYTQAPTRISTHAHARTHIHALSHTHIVLYRVLLFLTSARTVCVSSCSWPVPELSACHLVLDLCPNCLPVLYLTFAWTVCLSSCTWSVPELCTCLVLGLCPNCVPVLYLACARTVCLSCTWPLPELSVWPVCFLQCSSLPVPDLSSCHLLFEVVVPQCFVFCKPSCSCCCETPDLSAVTYCVWLLIPRIQKSCSGPASHMIRRCDCDSELYRLWWRHVAQNVRRCYVAQNEGMTVAGTAGMLTGEVTSTPSTG